ncbi:MAG: hypothetical protein ACNA8W_25400, partial [Bradymonadaceae bacterium]
AYLLTPDMDALRCALDAPRWNCDESPAREDFFPEEDAYRPIPRVLKREDYADPSGVLDMDRLKEDFACMSMVGTRGYGFEKGLLSAVTALSPELTGPGGPNEGFLRPEARTGIIFVSDENDCSHNGDLNESSTCGVAECTFDENDGLNLIPVDTLKHTLLENISASKRIATMDEDDVIVASIHGRYQPYVEPRPAVCEQGYAIPTSCSTSSGVAYSGHRYDAFIRQFSTFFPQPPANNPDAPLTGLICEDFTPALVSIARLFHRDTRGCFHDVFRCGGPGEWCPSDPYTGAPGTCTAYPNDAQRFYCDSGIQVRLKASGEDPTTRLENTHYCIPESIDQREFPNGCVVEPSRYALVECPGGPGLKLDWVEPQSHNVLSGFEIQARFTILPPDE